MERTEKSLLNRNTQNYWIVGILSLILAVFLPMAGSTAGLGWRWPTSFTGWIVYIVVKLASAALNMLIFHHFVLQAKVNIKDDPRFLEAERLLGTILPAYDPESPDQFFSKQYKRKGITLTVTTLLSTICIAQAVLTFDYLQFIVHIIVVIFAIIFGIQTMREDEDWWVKDYLVYAKWRVRKEQNEKTLAGNQEITETVIYEGNASELDNGGTSILEPTDSSSDALAILPMDVESSGDSVHVLGIPSTSDSDSDSIYLSDTCDQNEN